MMIMLVVLPVLGVFLVVGFIVLIYGPALSQWAKDMWDELHATLEDMIAIWKKDDTE